MVMRVGQDVDNYHLLKEISHGETAIIYQAVHRFMANRLVALKLLYKAQFSGKGDQEEFFREARLLAELQHPHILPLIDANVYEGLPYIITAFAAQGSLRSKLNHRPASPWTIGDALVVLRQIGEALHFAHQHNVVHSDVKPENILFLAETEAVLADFDIARVLSRANAAVQSLGGTSAYMAPEQFQGKVRKESDQYALGCIAYELLTGKRPFRGEDQATLMHAHLYEQPPAPTQVNANLPTVLDAIILKTMAKKYTDRYEDIPSFLQALTMTTETAGPQRRSPLILRGTTTKSADSLYYEKTELSIPEDTTPATRKRRPTKAITDKETPAPRRARTASTRTKDDQPAEKKQATREKKPVKSSASKTKLAETATAEILSAEKKARKKTPPASPTRKTSVDGKQVKKTTRSTPAKLAEHNTPAKSSVTKKPTKSVATKPIKPVAKTVRKVTAKEAPTPTRRKS